ncbi:acyl-CoA synthetase [Flexistipes sp.]|uniref:acyl-CoA synthetase n=1 Tax=Flexistipes sp. TaxID=3088135 RepID=UPI002E20F0D9|nr:AMP-binding protein [Flexistipes sp.]
MHNMKNYEKTIKKFNIDVPHFFNFGFDVVDKNAETKDKTALIWIDTDGETHEKYTFGDLKRMSNRFANVLKEQGFKKGDNLYVMVPRVPEWYSVMLGCFKLGVIPMPAPKILREKDIDYRLKASKARGAVVYGDSIEKFGNLSTPDSFTKIAIKYESKGWQNYEDLMAKAGENLSRDDVEPTKSTDPLIIYFTSGTTKFPKMVLHDQTYALGHYITARFWQDLAENDIHWTLSDTGWGKAVWGKLFGQWLIGTTAVMHNQSDRFDPELHLNILQNFGVTTFCAPPTAYRMLILQDLSKYDFSKLRHSVSAGEPLNPEVIRKWKEHTKTLIYDGYGQTETVNTVANYPCLEVKPGSMGKPAPGFTVDIVDDEANPMPFNEAGHIAIKAEGKNQVGIFRGYYRDEEATNAAFHNGWYFTGDKAYKDEDGYFWFVGRSDDVIKSSGYRVGPFEVESALQTHNAVAESAVIGAPDKLRGTIVKAFIVLKPGFEGSDELIRDIQEHVKNETAPYKYPREIDFVDNLPKTVSGKIRRVELRQMEENRRRH